MLNSNVTRNSVSNRGSTQQMRKPGIVDSKLLIPGQPHLPKSVQPKVMLANKKTPQVFPRMVHPMRLSTQQSPQPSPSNKVPQTPPKSDAPSPVTPSNRSSDVQLQRRKFLQMMRSGNTGEGTFEIRLPDHMSQPRVASTQQEASQNQPNTQNDTVSEKIKGEIEISETKIDSAWEEEYRTLITMLGGDVCDDDNMEEGLTPEEVEAFVREHGNTPKSNTPRPETIQFHTPFTSPMKLSSSSPAVASDSEEDSDDDL